MTSTCLATSWTYGAVDYTWSPTNLPGFVAGKSTGLSLSDSFGVRFEGQVMPALSGTYTFTAESGGAVTIWVNGTQVFDGHNLTSERGPGEVLRHFER